jgi:hypothetical protein
MAKDFILPLTVPAAGLKAIKVVTVNNVNSTKSDVIRSNSGFNNSDSEIRKSVLGTPIYTEVVIKKTSDVVVDGNTFSSPEYIRFDTCIVNIQQQRNIIKTPIQGRNGTVKEYISDGDYQISIKGSIFGDAPDKMPSKIIKDSHTLFIEPNELWIECDILRYLNIQYCVIESYTISQVEGSRSRVDIDMNILSDDPIEVKLGIKEQ